MVGMVSVMCGALWACAAVIVGKVGMLGKVGIVGGTVTCVGGVGRVGIVTVMVCGAPCACGPAAVTGHSGKMVPVHGGMIVGTVGTVHAGKAVGRVMV